MKIAFGQDQPGHVRVMLVIDLACTARWSRGPYDGGLFRFSLGKTAACEITHCLNRVPFVLSFLGKRHRFFEQFFGLVQLAAENFKLAERIQNSGNV